MSDAQFEFSDIFNSLSFIFLSGFTGNKIAGLIGEKKKKPTSKLSNPVNDQSRV